MDETVEWSNSFFLVPKANGKVRLCLDLARLNKALSDQSIEASHLMIFSQN